MKTNELYRCSDSECETVPVAAGAEMISLFAKGYKDSCSTEYADNSDRVILCRYSEAYMPPIGQNIRRLRLADGMTQRQLAYQLRVSTQAVSKWECGQAYPDMTLLVPITRLFRVTLDELFGCR